jgi:hypothetical protein
MDLQLTFANGKLSGDGNDDVGVFTIKGQYNSAERECWWTKTYAGSHDVFYRGYREGKGIWGTWEISPFAHGGFHIWPKQAGEEETESAKQREPSQLVDAIASAVSSADYKLRSAGFQTCCVADFQVGGTSGSHGRSGFGNPRYSRLGSLRYGFSK